MKKSFNYNFHDVLSMKIIIDRYNPLFARILEQKFAHYLIREDIANPDITIFIGAFNEDVKSAALLDEHYYVNKNRIFCKHKYKIARWKIQIDGFEDGNVSVQIDGNAPSFWVFPGGTIYSVIMLVLVRKGYIMLHASGVLKDKKAHVFTGRSGTGKTITVFNLLRKGFKYLGDDTVLLGKNEVLSFIKPLNIRFTYDVKEMLGVEFSIKDKFFIFLKNMLRFASFGYINLFTKFDIKKTLPEKLGEKGSIGKIFFLVQGDEFSLKRSEIKEDLATQMYLDLKFELGDLEGYIAAYNYVFSESQLKNYWQTAKDIVKNNAAGKISYRVGMPKKYTMENFESLLTKINEAN